MPEDQSSYLEKATKMYASMETHNKLIVIAAMMAQIDELKKEIEILKQKVKQ